MNAHITSPSDVFPLGDGPFTAPVAIRKAKEPRSMAVVHDWCPDFRGGERVLSEICRVVPDADVYTLFNFLSEQVKAEHFSGVRFYTSIADRLPLVKKYYRSLFFFCPFLIEQFNVTEYDIVVSSSAAFARGVITRPDQPHVCYVHSPVRYAWDEQFSYLDQGRLGFGPKGLLFRYMLHRLRTWDTRTAHGPDVLLANSRYVRARIRSVYGRDAEVVHPPVPLSELDYSPYKDDYYVSASFLAPYKRTDLVIKAFNAMPHRRLMIVGGGQQSQALRALAGPNIKFMGFLPRDQYIKLVSRAKALVFAGCEDFGIALAEAQGCGTPVIAFGRGGARDIVAPFGQSKQPTGVLFEKQSADAIRHAIECFENNHSTFRASSCLANAARFSVDLFRQRICAAIDRAVEVKRQHFQSDLMPV